MDHLRPDLPLFYPTSINERHRMEETSKATDSALFGDHSESSGGGSLAPGTVIELPSGRLFKKSRV